jgi:hypothetical protein
MVVALLFSLHIRLMGMIHLHGRLHVGNGLGIQTDSPSSSSPSCMPCGKLTAFHFIFSILDSGSTAEAWAWSVMASLVAQHTDKPQPPCTDVSAFHATFLQQRLHGHPNLPLASSLKVSGYFFAQYFILFCCRDMCLTEHEFLAVMSEGGGSKSDDNLNNNANKDWEMTSLTSSTCVENGSNGVLEGLDSDTFNFPLVTTRTHPLNLKTITTSKILYLVLII